MGFSFGKNSGVLTGGKMGPRYLPNNSYIQEYGLEQGSLFKVKMTAYKNPDVKITSQDNSINVESKPSITPIAEFEVLHNAESLSVSHSHIWKASSYEKAGESLLNGWGGKLMAGAKALQNLTTPDDKGKSETDFKTEFNTWSSLDVAKIYGGNSAPNFTVNFSLIATKNPLAEVIAPALAMTYLSYPTLNKKKDINSLLSIADDALLGNTDVKGSEGSKTKAKVDRATNSADGILKNVYKSVKNVTAGKWRYKVGDPPPFWVVSSSNGIIYMANAHIENVTVQYFGPWVEAPSESSLAEAFDGLAGAVKGLDPSSIFPDATQLNSFIPSLQGNASLGGYPSYATVSITFQHAFSKMFGEEWLLSMGGANNHQGATSSVS